MHDLKREKELKKILSNICWNSILVAIYIDIFPWWIILIKFGVLYEDKLIKLNIHKYDSTLIIIYIFNYNFESKCGILNF